MKEDEAKTDFEVLEATQANVCVHLSPNSAEYERRGNPFPESISSLC